MVDMTWKIMTTIFGVPHLEASIDILGYPKNRWWMEYHRKSHLEMDDDCESPSRKPPGENARSFTEICPCENSSTSLMWGSYVSWRDASVIWKGFEWFFSQWTYAPPGGFSKQNVLPLEWWSPNKNLVGGWFGKVWNIFFSTSWKMSSSQLTAGCC